MAAASGCDDARMVRRIFGPPSSLVRMVAALANTAAAASASRSLTLSPRMPTGPPPAAALSVAAACTNELHIRAAFRSQRLLMQGRAGP